MITLDKDEYIIFEIRKHWLVFASEVLFLVILALLPLFIFAYIPQISEMVVFKSSHNDFGNFTFLTIFYTFFLLILWNVSFIIWTDYYLDVWVVTNKKVIDVEQKGLFTRKVSTLYFDRIQDITFSIDGLVATYFDIGTVQIQTAGEEKLFSIRGVGNPVNAHEQLNNAIVQYRQKHIADIREGINNLA